MNAITTDMLNGVLEQITSLIPVVFPAVVGMLAIRKGISWVISMIRKA